MPLSQTLNQTLALGLSQMLALTLSLTLSPTRAHQEYQKLEWAVQPVDASRGSKPRDLIGLLQEVFGLWLIDQLGRQLYPDALQRETQGLCLLFRGQVPLAFGDLQAFLHQSRSE